MNQNLELELNLSPTNEIEINLSTAQKYMTKLKTHQKNTTDMTSAYCNGKQKMTYNSAYGTIEVSNLAKIHDQSEFNTQVVAQSEKIKETRNIMRNISYDIINIKNAVHQQNSLLGIDTLLSSIDFLGAELSNWRALEKNGKNTNMKPLEEVAQLKVSFDKAREESNNGKTPLIPSMYVTIYNEETIKDKIKLLTEAINKLENKRDCLNVNTLIKIKISNYGKEVLGVI